MPPDYEALARRIEVGEGADDALTEDMARALGWRQTPAPGDGMWWQNPVTKAWRIGLPDWLGSLDAAMSLALPGWRINVWESPDRDFVVNLHGAAGPRGVERSGRAPTLARAIAAAWCRARTETGGA